MVQGEAAAVTDLCVRAGRGWQGGLGSVLSLQPPLPPIQHVSQPGAWSWGKGTKEVTSQRTVQGSFVLPNWPLTHFALLLNQHRQSRQ